MTVNIFVYTFVHFLVSISFFLCIALSVVFKGNLLDVLYTLRKQISGTVITHRETDVLIELTLPLKGSFLPIRLLDQQLPVPMIQIHTRKYACSQSVSNNFSSGYKCATFLTVLFSLFLIFCNNFLIKSE